MFSNRICNELLGINPTYSCFKGEEIKRIKNPKIISTKRPVRTYTNWQLRTDYVETLDASKQANEIIAPLLNKINELILFKKKYECQFILMQVPIIENGCCPALVYDQEIINFCSKIGASIEIDLYANPYESDWDIVLKT
ncbi:DUF4279 domain-containing protein [Gottfriedia acidiceleris]|uniref:DUF4279 domain-containing protein n=1 Tax=Gottfriedia acidiceleris TaxID=371036 RepID=UPI003D19737D